MSPGVCPGVWLGWLCNQLLCTMASLANFERCHLQECYCFTRRPNVHCIVYIVHYIVYILHCTLYVDNILASKYIYIYDL